MADGLLESRVGDAGEREAVVGLKGEEGQLVSVGQDAGRRSQVRLESTRSVFEQEGRARSIQGHSKLKREVLGRREVVVKTLKEKASCKTSTSAASADTPHWNNEDPLALCTIYIPGDILFYSKAKTFELL